MSLQIANDYNYKEFLRLKVLIEKYYPILLCHNVNAAFITINVDRYKHISVDSNKIWCGRFKSIKNEIQLTYHAFWSSCALCHVLIIKGSKSNFH